MSGSNKHKTNSASETFDLGRRVGRQLRPGDIVALYGGLGAGKTVLAKGIAAAMGVDEEVVSPTFTILKTYEGNLVLQHFDLYRIEGEEELMHIGFYEMLGGGAVSLIEWPEHADNLPEHISVRLTGSGDDHRKITIEGMALR